VSFANLSLFLHRVNESSPFDLTLTPELLPTPAVISLSSLLLPLTSSFELIKHSMDLTPSTLTAVWSGVSTSRLNDPTEWTDCCLTFQPTTTTEGRRDEVFEIQGKGISVWRGMAIGE
jgi:hypothetical protein